MATLFLREVQPDGRTIIKPVKVEVRGTGVVIQSWEQHAEQPREKKEVNTDGISLQTV